MGFMQKIFLLLLLLICASTAQFGQNVKVIESNAEKIIIEINFDNAYQFIDTLINDIKFEKIVGKEPAARMAGEPWIPSFSVNLGISLFSNPTYKIISKNSVELRNKFILPYPATDTDGSPVSEIDFDKDIFSKDSNFPQAMVELPESYRFRFTRIQSVLISPFQYNPVKRTLRFNKILKVEIMYNNESEGYTAIEDPASEKFIKNNVLNYKHAKRWIGKEIDLSNKIEDEYWYNPSKKYAKIFVNEKDVYRIYYEDIQAQAGLNNAEIESFKLELYNSGEQVPLDIIDGGDGMFQPGDYFQFVGYPPPKSEYSYFNLYNNDNVYWFSTSGDSNSLRYEFIDAYPHNYNITVKEHLATVHFEKDSLFERLGYAPNGERDFWFWGEARGENGVPTKRFRHRFANFVDKSDENDNVTARANLHGLNNLSCSNDHKATISITDQYIGTIEWDGQTEATFEKSFVASIDSIKIFPTGNYFQVDVDGLTCNPNTSDVIRINWLELDYWRYNRTVTGNTQFYTYKPTINTIVRFIVFHWDFINDMKVYVPSKNRILDNQIFLNDPSRTVAFIDTVSEETDYFCVTDAYFKTPLSIEEHFNSNIRDVNLGADYIIITHPDFTEAANRLKTFRESNLYGYDNPRVQVIDVEDIYDEFSFGLLDPFAIKDFMKYAFDNWSGIPPNYLVLLGDMSYDYRGLLQSSRKNYIPSLPYHTRPYGLAFSDNNFVTIVGDDLIPEMAVGRLSCETIEEANELLDKIMYYPSDDTKSWKERALLIGAGEDEEDENRFGFNDDNVDLENNFLTPNGYTSLKVFRFPNRPEYTPYLGGGPEIRAAFNKGVVLSNFYGHGGGSQWDLVFTNDDILLLDNGGKLPFVLSVSCYTAHFDNQTAFGEIFNRVPGKGSIGFWGNTGLTYYGYGKSINNKLFDQIFNLNNNVVGDAILNAKVAFAANGAQFIHVKDHLALFTLLGDPAVRLALPDKPDFKVNPEDIFISPENPLAGDTVLIKSIITNEGRIFPDDSVSVQFFINFSDTSYLIKTEKLASFGQTDSIIFNWLPVKDGLATLRIVVNDVDIIDEMDYSNNASEFSFTIFDLNEPQIIKPIDGFFTSTGSVKFLFADIGHYVNLNLQYLIEIDTTIFFTDPIFKSPSINPLDGILEYQKEGLNNGVYFWRARLFDGQKYSSWSTIRSFSISGEDDFGYLASEKQLKLFSTNNFIYSDSLKSLILNTNLLPPKPSTNKVLDTIKVDIEDPGFIMSSITTDGQYIYYANKLYYNDFENSPIYKVGTGYNSVAGMNYDSIPNFTSKITNQIFYHDGFIYVIYDDAYNIIKVNPETGDSSLVNIPSGLLDNSVGTVEAFNSAYACSDGEFVYNITFKDSSDNADVFVIRKLDPNNNWEKVGDDLRTTSSSWGNLFSGFFVAKGYIFPYENFDAGWMRRIRLSDGFFEEEFLTNSVEEGFQGYHSWCYDVQNDIVYGSIARAGLDDEIRKFVGTYKQSSGTITTPLIGPASNWNSVSFDVDLNGYTGDYENYLLGFNKNTYLIDTLQQNLPQETDISNINIDLYDHIKMHYVFVDTTAGQALPPKVSKFKVKFNSLPEIVTSKKDITISPDSILQGLDVTINFSAKNYGYKSADSTIVNLFLNGSDTTLYSKLLSIPPDSSKSFSYTLNTSPLLFQNSIKAETRINEPEFFTFNNLNRDSFYVARDSVKPEFEITFDGLEIISGDIVSATPNIFMSLKDNSPLPLDTSDFSIYLNNNPISFTEDSLRYSYTEYPNSESQINWQPNLIDGKHVLDVYAKDASDNYFDSTSYRISFKVDRENKVEDIYNYPNPFADDTYFTFNITGSKLPEEMDVKVFTVTGRLIKEIEIPVEQLGFGFNKFYWDGKDQDGNIIANGVYFCKFIIQNNGEYTTEVKKIAKLK
jgi:hypothetical protein